MIDPALRAKYMQNSLIKGMKDVMSSSLKSGNPNEEVLKLVVKREDDVKLQGSVDKIGQALVLFYNLLKKPMVLPRIFQVTGKVEITKQPKVTIENIREFEKYFTSLEKTFNHLLLAIQGMPQPQIKLPKIEIPAQVNNANPELLEAIENLNERIENLSSPEAVSMSKTNELLEALVNRPQLTPQPVTNISINALQGFAKATSQTVGTSVVELPSYGQLFNRRSIIVFNNDATNTLYIGGSDVTTSNGMPVLAQTYSPSIDAGYNMDIYGIAGSSINVRVFEVSKDQTANVQE